MEVLASQVVVFQIGGGVFGADFESGLDALTVIEGSQLTQNLGPAAPTPGDPEWFYSLGPDAPEGAKIVGNQLLWTPPKGRAEAWTAEFDVYVTSYSPSVIRKSTGVVITVSDLGPSVAPTITSYFESFATAVVAGEVSHHDPLGLVDVELTYTVDPGGANQVSFTDYTTIEVDEDDPTKGTFRYRPHRFDLESLGDASTPFSIQVEAKPRTWNGTAYVLHPGTTDSFTFDPSLDDDPEIDWLELVNDTGSDSEDDKTTDPTIRGVVSNTTGPVEGLEVRIFLVDQGADTEIGRVETDVEGNFEFTPSFEDLSGLLQGAASAQVTLKAIAYERQALDTLGQESDSDPVSKTFTLVKNIAPTIEGFDLVSKVLEQTSPLFDITNNPMLQGSIAWTDNPEARSKEGHTIEFSTDNFASVAGIAVTDEEGDFSFQLGGVEYDPTAQGFEDGRNVTVQARVVMWDDFRTGLLVSSEAEKTFTYDQTADPPVAVDENSLVIESSTLGAVRITGDTGPTGSEGIRVAYTIIEGVAPIADGEVTTGEGGAFEIVLDDLGIGAYTLELKAGDWDADRIAEDDLQTQGIDETSDGWQWQDPPASLALTVTAPAAPTIGSVGLAYDFGGGVTSDPTFVGEITYQGDYEELTVKYDFNNNGLADGEAEVYFDESEGVIRFRFTPAGLWSVDSSTLQPGEDGHQVRVRVIAPDHTAAAPDFGDNLLGDNGGDLSADWYAGDFFGADGTPGWDDATAKEWFADAFDEDGNPSGWDESSFGRQWNPLATVATEWDDHAIDFTYDENAAWSLSISGVADPMDLDPKLTGVLSQNGSVVADRMLAFYLNGSNDVDGYATTALDGSFSYTPSSHTTGQNDLVIKMLSPVYGGDEDEFSEVPVTGYGAGDGASITFLIDPSLTLGELSLVDPTSTDPLEAIDPTLQGVITGGVEDVALQVIEFDYNGDGLADASTLTDGLGGFEFTAEGVGAHKIGMTDQVSVRARLVEIVSVGSAIAGTARVYRVMGEWTDPLEWTVVDKPVPVFSSLGLEHDTGHYGLAYEVLDGVTSDPTLIGRAVDDQGSPLAFTSVEFDHDGDGNVDGYTATDEAGRFSYEPEGLTLGYWDVRARVVVADPANSTAESPAELSTGWVSVTRSGDPADVGHGVGFTLVAADALQVAALQWESINDQGYPAVSGQVDWVLIGGAAGPGAAGVTVDFFDETGFALGSTQTDPSGAFEFVPIGLAFSSESATDKVIKAVPRQSQNVDSVTVSNLFDNGAIETASRSYLPGGQTLSQPTITRVDLKTAEASGTISTSSAPQYVEVRVGGANAPVFTAPVQASLDGAGNAIYSYAYSIDLTSIVVGQANIAVRLVSYDANGFVVGGWTSAGISELAPTLGFVSTGSLGQDPYDGFVASATPSVDFAVEGSVQTNSGTFNNATVTWEYEVEYDLDGDGFADEVYAVDDPGGAFSHTLDSGEPGEFGFKARVVGYGTFEETAGQELTLRAEGDWFDAAVEFDDPAPQVDEGTLSQPTATEATITGGVTAGYRQTVSGLTIEVDEDGDGYADGRTVVLADGTFEYTLREGGVGVHDLQVRAVDPYSDVEPLEGAWVSFSLEVVPHDPPPVEALDLEGYIDSGGPMKTADPVIVGHADFSTLPGASLRWVEFDHNGDGVVDGRATVDATGAFRYSADGLAYGDATIVARSVAQVGDQRVVGDWSDEYVSAPTQVLTFLHEPIDLPEITGELTLTDASRGVITGRVTTAGFGVAARVQVSVMNGGVEAFNGSVFANASGRFEYELLELGAPLSGSPPAASQEYTIRVRGLVADSNAPAQPASPSQVTGYYAGASRDLVFDYQPAAAVTPSILTSDPGKEFDLAYVTDPGSSTTSDPTVKGWLDLTSSSGVVPPQTYIELTYGYADPDTQQPILRTIPVRGDGYFEYTPDNYQEQFLSFEARVKHWDPTANNGAGDYAYSGQTESTPAYTLSQLANAAPIVTELKLYNNKAGANDTPQSGDPAFSGTVSNDGRLGGLTVYFDHNGDGVPDGQTVTKRDGSFFYRADGLEPSDTLTQTMTAWVVEEDYWGEELASATFQRGFILTRSPLIDQLSRSGQVVSGTVFSEADPADVWVEYEVLGGGAGAAIPEDLAAYLASTSNRSFLPVSSGSFSLDLSSLALAGPVTIVARGVDTSGVTTAFTDPSGIDEADYQAEAVTGPWRVLNFIAASGSETLISGFGLVDDTGSTVGDIVTSNATVEGNVQPYQVVEFVTEKYNDDLEEPAWVHVATERKTANAKGHFEFASGALVADGSKYRVTAAAVYFDTGAGAEAKGDPYLSPEFSYITNEATLTISGGANGLLSGSVTAGPDGQIDGLRVEVDVDYGDGFDGVPDAFAITAGGGLFELQLYGLQPSSSTEVRARVIEWDSVAGAFSDPDFGDESILAVDHATVVTDGAYNGDPGLADYVTDDLAGLGQADATVRAAIAAALADSSLSGLSAVPGVIDVGAGSAPVLGLGGARAAGPDADESLTAISLSTTFTPSNFNGTTETTGSGVPIVVDGAPLSFSYEIRQEYNSNGVDAWLETSISITIAGFALGGTAGTEAEGIEVGTYTYDFDFRLDGDEVGTDQVTWTDYSFTELIGYSFYWTRVERLTEEDDPYLTETVAGTYTLEYAHPSQSTTGGQFAHNFSYTETIHVESWLEETDPTPPEGSSYSRSDHAVYDEETTNTGFFTGSTAEGTLVTSASGRYDSEVNTSYSTYDEFSDGYDSAQDYVTQTVHYEGTLDATIHYVTGSSVEGDFDLSETFVSGLIQSGGGSYARGGDSGSWSYEAEGSATTSSALVGSFEETATTDTLDAVLTVSTNAGIEGSGGGSGSYGASDDEQNFDRGTTTTSYTFGVATSATLKATITASGDDYDVIGKLGVSASTTLTDSATVSGQSKTTTGSAEDTIVTDVTYGARIESSAGASFGIDSDFGYNSAGASSAKGDFNASAYGSVTTASQAYGTTKQGTGEEMLTLPFRENELTTASLAFAAAGVFSATVRPGQADSRSTEGQAQRLESATIRTTSYAGLAGPAEALALGDGSAGGGDIEASLANFTLTKTYAATRDQEEYDFADIDGAQSRAGVFRSDEEANVETITQIVASGEEEDFDWSYRYRSDAQAATTGSTAGSFSEPTSGQRTASAAIDEVFTTFSREESVYRASGDDHVDNGAEISDTNWKLRSSLFAEGMSTSTSSGMVYLAGDEVTTSAIDVAFTSEGLARTSDRSSSSTTGTLTDGTETTDFQSSANGSSRARLRTTTESSGVVSDGAPGLMNVRAIQNGTLRASSTVNSQEKTTGGGRAEEVATSVTTSSRAKRRSKSTGVVQSGAASSTEGAAPAPSSVFDVSVNSSGHTTTTSTWKTSYDESNGADYLRGSSGGERIDTGGATSTADVRVTTGADGRRREVGAFDSQTNAEVMIHGDYQESARRAGVSSTRSGPIEVDQTASTTTSGAMTSDHGQTTIDVTSSSDSKSGDSDLRDKYTWRMSDIPEPPQNLGGGGGGGGGSDEDPQEGEMSGGSVESREQSGFGIPRKAESNEKYFLRSKIGDATKKEDDDKGFVLTQQFSLGLFAGEATIETTNIKRETKNPGEDKLYTEVGLATQTFLTQGDGEGDRQVLILTNNSVITDATTVAKNPSTDKLSHDVFFEQESLPVRFFRERFDHIHGQPDENYESGPNWVEAEVPIAVEEETTSKTTTTRSFYFGTHTLGSDGRSAVGGVFIATSNKTEADRFQASYDNEVGTPGGGSAVYEKDELRVDLSGGVTTSVIEVGSYHDDANGKRIQPGNYTENVTTWTKAERDKNYSQRTLEDWAWQDNNWDGNLTSADSDGIDEWVNHKRFKNRQEFMIDARKVVEKEGSYSNTQSPTDKVTGESYRGTFELWGTLEDGQFEDRYADGVYGEKIAVSITPEDSGPAIGELTLHDKTSRRWHDPVLNQIVETEQLGPKVSWDIYPEGTDPPDPAPPETDKIEENKPGTIDFYAVVGGVFESFLGAQASKYPALSTLTQLGAALAALGEVNQGHFDNARSDPNSLGALMGRDGLSGSERENYDKARTGAQALGTAAEIAASSTPPGAVGEAASIIIEGETISGDKAGSWDWAGLALGAVASALKFVDGGFGFLNKADDGAGAVPKVDEAAEAATAGGKFAKPLTQFLQDIENALSITLYKLFKNNENYKRLRKIDPDAKIGLTGSARTGVVSNRRKPRYGQPIAQDDFDVDVFVASDKLYEIYKKRGPNKNGVIPAELLRETLAKDFPEIFAGLRPGGKGASIKFRPSGDIPGDAFIFPF